MVVYGIGTAYSESGSHGGALNCSGIRFTGVNGIRDQYGQHEPFR